MLFGEWAKMSFSVVPPAAFEPESGMQPLLVRPQVREVRVGRVERVEVRRRRPGRAQSYGPELPFGGPAVLVSVWPSPAEIVTKMSWPCTSVVTMSRIVVSASN